MIRVVPYAPEHRSAFRDLNLDWITEYFEVEQPDRDMLGDPEGHILAHGGRILIAVRDGEPVGACALLALGEGSFELAKMAVARSARGLGVGRALGEAAIAEARALGARRVELLSNTVLVPAITLYRSLGFAEAPMSSSEYRRANIRMVLDLADLGGGDGAARRPMRAAAADAPTSVAAPGKAAT